MPNWGVRLTNRQVKKLFSGVMLCLSFSLTVACQQAEKTSSSKDAQDLTAQPKNQSQNPNIVKAPQRTPGEITVNLPSPFPSSIPNNQPQGNPNAGDSVAEAPQNQATVQPSEQPSNSISKALTEKLAPKTAVRQSTPQPETQQPVIETPKPVVQALKNAAKSPRRKIAAARSTNVYKSRRLGVNFKYPKGFVIKEPQETSGSSNKVLELWSLKDYQEIAKGKFQNTFSPGNVSISLENNPQGLSLVKWVTSNEELGEIIPESYDVKVVAGREAMSFRTEGLYEFQNVALPSNDGKQVILISFAEGDRNYQQLFEQVVSSLQVN